MTDTCDIAIIGMGPVGAMLANFLGLRGVCAIALEREAATYHLPRAVTFDDEIMRLFQILGLSDEMQKTAEVGSGALFVDAAGETLLHWDRPMTPTANGWCPNYRFHQPDLETVLKNGLRRFPHVECRWNCMVTAISQDGTGVRVTYRQDKKDKELQAAYAVGCDGGRSLTRAAIGGGLEDLGFHEQWLIADLLLPEPEPDPDRHTYHYCGTQRMGSKVFVGSRRKRWEFRLNPDDDPETICEPDNVWRILEPWITPDEAVLERATVYTFHSVIAQRWRDRRLFIAGDAAHQTPPFMGQGMCAGLRDAANLGWKLAHVVDHRAADAFLDTYESERAPHVRSYIDLTIQLGQLINKTASAVSGGNISEAASGTQNMAQLKPRLGSGLQAGEDGLRGTLFPLLDAALEDRIGMRPALVSAHPLPGALRVCFEAAGCSVIQCDIRAMKDWFSTACAEAVLIRPDRAILGTVADISDAAQLLPQAWRSATD